MLLLSGPCIFIVNEALLDNVIEKWTLVDDEWYLIRSREVRLNFQQNQIYNYIHFWKARSAWISKNIIIWDFVSSYDLEVKVKKLIFHIFPIIFWNLIKLSKVIQFFIFCLFSVNYKHKGYRKYNYLPNICSQWPWHKEIITLKSR